MKFIHTADLHLDSKIDGLPAEKSRIRKEEIVNAFERLAEYANNNGVLAVIIAGDMFDTSRVTLKTRARVLHAISANKDVDFLYLSGNHDDDNFLSEIDELPHNLKVFNDVWTAYRYDNVVISGITLVGENSKMAYDTLSLNENDVNVVVMHGQVVGYKSKEKTETISIPSLKEKNIDYLALGHIHSYAEGKIDERGKYAYCGCLEGRGFDELGDKGFVLIDTNDDNLRTEFVKFSKRNLYEYEFDVSSFSDWYVARENLMKILSNLYSKNSLLKVVLVGEHKADFEIDKNNLVLRLNEEFFFAKVYDKTELKINIEEYAHDKSVRGEFVRAVWESDLSLEIKNKVIMCGLNALKGEDVQ